MAGGWRTMRWAVLLTLLLVAMPLVAQDAAPTPTPGRLPSLDQAVIVAVREVPPFAFSSPTGVRGFSIDLWNEIAARLNMTSAFHEEATVTDQLDSVREGNADLAITAISITEQREETLDFSVPMFRGGLQILAPATSGLSLQQMFAALLRPSVTGFLLVVVVFVVVSALALWLVERFLLRRTGDAPAGLGATMYESARSFMQADLVSGRGRSLIGRTLSLLWLFIALLLAIQFEAIVTANLTVDQLTSQVQGLADLYDKRVYTIEGSTAEEFLINAGIEPLTTPDIEGAFAHLMKGEADAIVYDAPVLAYLEATRGQGRVHTVGDPFRLEYYGIALPQGSPLKEPIDRAMLAIMEDGTYERLLAQWFSS